MRNLFFIAFCFLTSVTYGQSTSGPVMKMSNGVLSVGNGKTLTVSNSITLSGTDGSTLAIGTGGTALIAANNLSDVGSASTTRNNILPSKTGNSLKYLRVNAGETDYEVVTLVGGGDLLSTNNLSDVSNAGTARTNLGLAIGTNVQAFDADLTTYAGITPSANVQTMLGSADNAAIRSNIGLVINTDVAPATSGSAILKGNGSGGFSSTTANTDYQVAGTTISPSQITSDQDNWNPSGLDACNVIRLSGDATIRAITSITAPSGETVPQYKTLINIGSYPVYLPSEHPDGTAANRFINGKDYILHPGRSCQIAYDGTSSRWRIISNDVPIVANTLYMDFYAGSVTSGDFGNMTFLTIGTGTNTATAATTTLPASMLFSTAASATAGFMGYFSKSVVSYSAFGTAHNWAEAVISIPTLSTGTETFFSYLQLTTTPSSTTAEVNNSCGIRYNEAVNSGKWQLYTQDNAGAESVADLGITVAANTLYKLRIEVDKGRTEVRAYINDVYAGRVTGNMPNAVVIGSRTLLVKTVGTTARTMAIHSQSAGAVHTY